MNKSPQKLSGITTKPAASPARTMEAIKVVKKRILLPNINGGNKILHTLRLLCYCCGLYLAGYRAAGQRL